MPVSPETAKEYQAILAVYYPRVRAYLAQVVHDRGVVEDMTQEVFLRLLARGWGGEPIEDQWGFIKGIVHNILREYLRRELRRKKAAAMIPQSLSREEPLGTAMVKTEDASIVRELVRQLEPVNQYIITGRYFLELTFRKLAEDIGVAEGTVIYRHARSMHELRNLALERGVSL